MSSKSRISLVVFDWAGTTVDFGSCAPAMAFQRLFANAGITLTSQTARGPMGTNKRDHLLEILGLPQVSGEWRRRYGRDWNISDVDTLYAEFRSVQLQAIAESTELVPGLIGCLQWLKDHQVRFAGTTGYFREAADAVKARAHALGYSPQVCICADDVPHGRPAPWMIYRAMEYLNVYPPQRVINVGDTVADIQSGLAAGCWSVGVCDSSSETGLTLEVFNSLSEQEKLLRMRTTAEVLIQAGCHAVLRTIADLPALLTQIDQLPTSSPQQLPAWLTH